MVDRRIVLKSPTGVGEIHKDKSPTGVGGLNNII